MFPAPTEQIGVNGNVLHLLTPDGSRLCFLGEYYFYQRTLVLSLYILERGRGSAASNGRHGI